MEEKHHTKETHHTSHKPHARKEETVTLKKSTLWKVATFVFAGLFVLSLFTGGFGFRSGPSAAPTPTAAPSPSPLPSPTGGSVKLSLSDDDPVLGDPDAPISIVEFSDFQCPFCARAASGTLTDFKDSDYFKDGEVNLVYKHFPLNSIHPFAQKAAEASECANRQGEFWEYHDTLFENQRSLSVADLKGYADDIGLDTDEFDSCLDDDEARAKVAADLAAASAAGGRGTPYFVIVNQDGDTQAVSGAVPFSVLEAAIQALQ